MHVAALYMSVLYVKLEETAKRDYCYWDMHISTYVLVKWNTNAERNRLNRLYPETYTCWSSIEVGTIWPPGHMQNEYTARRGSLLVVVAAVVVLEVSSFFCPPFSATSWLNSSPSCSLLDEAPASLFAVSDSVTSTWTNHRKQRCKHTHVECTESANIRADNDHRRQHIPHLSTIAREQKDL